MRDTLRRADFSYLPMTSADREKMLEVVGAESVEELFAHIPENARLHRELDLPPGLSEPELVRLFQDLACRNKNTDQLICFLGGGVYDRYIPAVVNQLASREEFYSSYTPYQAEVSQGMLQAIYEYQTYICRLTGMDVSNASMYDGATALAEAAVMAFGESGRRQVVVPITVNPTYRSVLKTYCSGLEIDILESGYAHGVARIDELQERVKEETACVIVQQPNFFGCLEPVEEISNIAHSVGAAYIVCIEPISLGLLVPPSDYGADIVVGEGQGLGSPMNFGGPLLGIFAAREKYLWRLPGRLVGATVDTEGNRAYCLTLQTREQHIRRERATSNICTNQSLNALTAAVYLSVLGRRGLAHVADLSFQKAHYAAEEVSKLPGYSLAWDRPFFQEFVLRCPESPEVVSQRLLERRILGGIPLGKWYSELADCLLIAVTEKRTKAEIDALVEGLAG